MRSNHLFLITVFLIVLTSFSSGKPMATSWAYSFVVWDGYIYVISNENVTEVDSEIGQVSRYSDMEQYSGNFSNAYKKGTKYYSIEGIGTDDAIAIGESDGQYIKAYREGEYEFDGKQGILNIFILSILCILVVIIFNKVQKINR
ncbi:hypothetical protein [Mesobacillus selenatarsenatis]|uniref:Uncharacterized protein n=1 Tax=Mesobacillus selenatarsenatis (strain DSM 18680 / JCM 14380 / FERM P-15431 / SF-1) TaxID=1321606 RepID=A0A0A8X0C1_MESS1|nr:hypothetical protein [Mesobacillus selenatarsenatis]GAM12452.1 hypothetical protein SAMD00020551_0586 [Mesobacillus selenatarsenatis SF-1]